MAEETGIQTNEAAVATEATVDSVVDTVESTETSNTETTTTEVAAEEAATIPFSKEKLDWQDLDFTDEQKEAAIGNYSNWFKNEESANAFLKALSDAKKTEAEARAKADAEAKEARAKKILETEAGWDKSLRTDSVYGKDFDANNKRVDSFMEKFWTEEERSELKKFGYSKFDIVRKGLLRAAMDQEDPRVAGVGQPAPAQSGQPRDRWGNTMFDFTKKQ